MTETISLQYNVFIMFIYVGATLGFVYDIIRCFRRLISHNNIFIGIEDIVFWLVSAMIMINRIQVYNFGEFRLYIFFSGILGFAIYHYTISCVFMRFASYILLSIKKTTKNLKKMLKKGEKKVKIIISVKRNR